MEEVHRGGISAVFAAHSHGEARRRDPSLVQGQLDERADPGRIERLERGELKDVAPQVLREERRLYIVAGEETGRTLPVCKLSI